MLSTLMECWKGELDPINVSFTINGEKFESEIFLNQQFN